jgi:chromosome segregation ATPase
MLTGNPKSGSLKSTFLFASLSRMTEQPSNKIITKKADVPVTYNEFQELKSMISSLSINMDHKFGIMEKNFEIVDKRFDQIDKRFDQVDKRFDEVDKRFDEIDKRFDGVDKRFDEIDKRFDGVDKRFDEMDKRFDEADKHFDEMDKRFDKVGIQLLEMDSRINSNVHSYKALMEEQNSRNQSVMDAQGLILLRLERLEGAGTA